MKKAPIYSQYAVITHGQASEKSQPRIGALDFPAPFVAPQFASIRIRLRLLVLPIGSNQLNASSFQPAPQRIAIISLVGYDALRALSRPTPRAWDFDLGERRFGQRGFVRGCRRQENSQRNTLAISQNHPLGTLAPLGFSHGQAPFFAEAKLPSKKVSSQRSRPRRSSCDSKLRPIFPAPLALPNPVNDASRSIRWDTAAADRATLLPCVTPITRLRSRPDCRPKAVHVHHDGACASEKAVPTSSTAGQ